MSEDVGGLRSKPKEKQQSKALVLANVRHGEDDSERII